MSDTGTTPLAPKPPLPDADASATAPPQRSGCLNAFMVVGGLVLLLPGMCFLAVGGNSSGLALIGLVLLCAATALLLSAAIRKWGLSPPPS
ncbi:hypothetical protein [Bradyrhizobium sp. Y36]|uniref:hypothetical protein n=1 Tax=Bradyrhizobium sp. Y36 TaxID=2035447 RepID=UPI00117773E4|nr:hypothetical protein [Bradyrhizobium sp. Y36]